jgi:hypothetical protein
MQEQAFQQWAQQHGIVGDAQDYDTRGAFLAGMQPDARGHLADTYKLPNHITFSNESIFSNPLQQGGRWETGPDGRSQFHASEFNLQNYPAERLQQYFQQQEPDTQLVLPMKGVFNTGFSIPSNPPQDILNTMSLGDRPKP